MSKKHDTLSLKDFNNIRTFVYDTIGINLSSAKKVLIETRLRKRMQKLGIAKYRDYCKYFFSDEGQKKELVDFINIITTNKTDFFREPKHFDFLKQTILPDLLSRRHDLVFWSAACSRGAEPYTLAMVLEDYDVTHLAQKMHYTIVATDISTKVLKEAVKGVYKEEEVEPVPLSLRRRYLLRSKDQKEQLVRIIPALRQKVQYTRINLVEPFHLEQKVDVIFCRNVMIYFDKKTQYQIISHMISFLKPDGYLIMGHSEVLDVRTYNLISIIPSVYQKRT